jgi:hypothetical protein
LIVACGIVWSRWWSWLLFALEGLRNLDLGIPIESAELEGRETKVSNSI